MLVKLLYDLLEPYAMKVARTVLRGEGISNNPNLPDIGRGGNLIDFGVLYHGCSVHELLQKLGSPSSFQQHKPRRSEDPRMQDRIAAGEDKNRIKILSDSPIHAPALIHYLSSRAIPLELAQEHCRQVIFEVHGKRITALGFPNRSGGYELRNTNFKGSSSPKDISLIDNHTEEIAVFEGFFNFLSFKTINQHKQGPLTNCLILNSLAFFEKSRPMMEQYKQIHLVLDNDTAGKKHTSQALQWTPQYLDRSDFYSQHKDLNDWLKDQIVQPRQQLRQGRHL